MITPLRTSGPAYPEFTPHQDFSLVTRMLVFGDGSTTALLQQIAGSTLVADVLPSCAIDAGIHPLLGEVFTSTAGQLRLRHTRLRDGTGAVVSENLITYRAADADTLIPPAGVPFGTHVRRLGLYERRRLFDSGLSRQSFGLLPPASVGRCYEIAFSSLQRVLVHEVFNPDLLASWLDVGRIRPPV
ncbi:hypothetical protein [Nocardia abscessus]|uniref:hypothetical protein n=1 Tax=Nocardia abscessus TaxID=120957 RepID=UPI0024560BFE|nr:hypothetical protein [Nocardia abscessus]